MYRVKLKNDQIVNYLFDRDIFSWDQNGVSYAYLKVSSGSEEEEIRQKSLDKGFSFADRVMVMDCAADFKAFKGGSRLSFDWSKDWDRKAVFDIAKKDFVTDRRFSVHLRTMDEGVDQERFLEEGLSMKDELLYWFIGMLQDDGLSGSFLRLNGTMIGFNLWKIEEGKGRIMLGYVEPKYRSMYAAMLYTSTIRTMREEGALSLREKVSTSNIASFNLHLGLIMRAGGRVKITGYEDVYLWNEKA